MGILSGLSPQGSEDHDGAIVAGRVGAAGDSLKFGTSGLRGLVTDLVGLPSRAYAFAFVQHALSLVPRTAQVLVGRDLRSSSPQITADCLAAIRQAGLEAVDCGTVPTPALALEAMRLGVPAIMVTGSHIPDDRNGLKFYLPHGEIGKDDEAAIADRFEALDRASLALLGAAPAVDVREVALLGGAVEARYLRRYVDFFGAGSLSGRRVAVYQHSSVARDLLVRLLEALGAEVAAFGRAAGFVPVDTEAHAPAQVAYIAGLAQAGRFDAIVSTDGDADRPLVADEAGTILRGDVLGLLSAQLLGMRTIVTPVTSGSVVERSQIADRVVRTRVGSPYVIAGLQEAAQAGFTGLIGFEANGGTLVGSEARWDGRSLTSLPTRDAVLPILCCLYSVAETGRPLSAVVADLAVGHALADRLPDIPSVLSRDFLARLANDPAFAATHFHAVGTVVSVSPLDGMRFELSDGSVVHYRASGNAPELRCYVEARDKERAEALLAFGLAAASHQLDRKQDLPIQH